MKPRALVIEPDFSGHRWRYVQWAVEALVEAGYECIISTDSNSRAHPLLESYEAGPSPVDVVYYDKSGLRASAFLSALACVKADFAFYAAFEWMYRETTRSRQVDLVVVPFGDYILNAIGFLGSPFGASRWMCIVMRQTFHHRDMGVNVPPRPFVDYVKKQLFFLALRRGNLSTVLTIDPTLAAWCENLRVTGRQPTVRYLADPFPEMGRVGSREARGRLGLRDERTILVYGAITDRKGIKELLSACKVRETHPLVVIAGEQSDDVRAFLSSLDSRSRDGVVVFDHFISPEMEVDLFCACDAVWVGYKGHYGMSGVLVQAYRCGKTVLASAFGLIGWFVKHDRLGPVLEDLSIPTINAAIDEVLACAGERGRVPVAESDGGQLLAAHTVSNFKNTLRSAL
ncbi:glycosyltransferase [Trinickia dinghuensis]|uniref:Glycosyltransferase family 1 protein n=1 Tax=Trinickia dinghuensis TaxID=2291023 RepID=A0A3D8K3Z4_9BURK|nr:glycosyltransferase [Trinickia dinghuensis]RDU99595.1 glycosyltransferase family 1 protein [Trinickia dinghuensis]